jgi:cbb3-type cytochrome oxidase cytochrome c subunit
VETPEDRFYNPARINAWFAVSAILVLAATVAAILADHYDREWKNYQKAFHELERKRAEEAIALEKVAPATAPAEALKVRNLLLRGDAEKGDGPSTLAAAELAVAAAKAAGGDEAKVKEAVKAVVEAETKGFDAALDAAKADAAFPTGAVLAARAFEEEAKSLDSPEMDARKAALDASRDKVEEQRFKTEKEQRGLQALVDEYKSRMDHARSQGLADEAAAVEKQWQETFAKEKGVHARMDGFAADKLRIIGEMKDLMSPVSNRQGRAVRLRELAGVSGAQKKIASFVAGGLRDAPLLDPFAPLTKIDQRVYPELTVDYNFTQTPRVDRCVTCHSGIDKVRVDPKTGEVSPVFTAENTPERVFRTHSRPELYVSSVSKHPVDKLGCTVCHEGLGWGLSFSDAYHTPSTPAQEKEWEEKFHWERGDSWDFPMLPQKYIESSCFKCHRDQTRFNSEDKFIKEIPSAPLWNRGLHIVERHGCFGCHKIDGLAVAGLDKWIAEIKDEDRLGYAMAISIRKTGPSLKRISSKWVSREAAWKWIWHPQALRPNTNMPRFFGQPNNRGVDPLTGHDYDLRTRTEVWGLLELIWSQAQEPEEPAKAVWKPEEPPVKGDPARGKMLFGGRQEAAYGSPEAADEGESTVGCVACHATKDFPNPMAGGVPNDFGPELSTVGSKTTQAWLYTWLKGPSHYWAGTRMPSLRLTDQEAADIAAYLGTLRNTDWEKDVPPPASEAAVRDLAVEAVRATARPGEDPEAIVKAASPRERLLMVGRRALARYACFGCHEIRGYESAERIGTELGGSEGWGSKDVDRLDFGMMEDRKAVETYRDWNTGIIAERPDGARALPHRKPEWAWLKLKNPRVYDAGVTRQPHEKLVMPNFHFTDDEASSVVCFLLSLQRGEVPASKRRLRDSREVLAEKMKWVVRQYNCYGCHTVTRTERVEADGRHVPIPKGGDIRSWLGKNKDNWPPSLGGEGIVGEGTRVQPTWLFSFLRDPVDRAEPGKNLLRFWIRTRMPTFGFTQQELNSLVQGFAAEDEVPFPYEFQQAEDLSGKKERGEDARLLFKELECAKCHPTRGAKQEGPAPSGLAPDLTYAHDRLRYQWVKLWLDNPAAILPGTKMPAFWRPEASIFEAPNGLSKPFFGNDPREQIKGLADYVFGIGKPAGESGSK